MRGTYGPDQPYTEMAARALILWQKYERRWKRRFLHRTGVLWMASGREDDNAFESGSVKMLRAAKIEFQELSAAQLRKRWPQITFEGIEWGIFEPRCGYLDARASCQAVVEAFVAAGGKYRQQAVLGDGLRADELKSRPLRSLALSDGSRIKADAYVFACGPWLGKLFPQTIGNLVQPTKQDVFFFGTPAGDDRFTEAHLPVWADHRGRFRYGIPGSGRRGFKIADDTRGVAFDPTDGERVVSQETLKDIREYVGFRFPALKNAPLVETRICQYEQTPDSHFIIDRHPAMENVWIVGGGSGHGFKHGPVIGQMVSESILQEREPAPIFGLARFKKH
jgi:glycine/D-amino acid oxidase-like deaminating enzyme